MPPEDPTTGGAVPSPSHERRRGRSKRRLFAATVALVAVAGAIGLAAVTGSTPQRPHYRLAAGDVPEGYAQDPATPTESGGGSAAGAPVVAQRVTFGSSSVLVLTGDHDALEAFQSSDDGIPALSTDLLTTIEFPFQRGRWATAVAFKSGGFASKAIIVSNRSGEEAFAAADAYRTGGIAAVGTVHATTDLSPLLLGAGGTSVVYRSSDPTRQLAVTTYQTAPMDAETIRILGAVQTKVGKHAAWSLSAPDVRYLVWHDGLSATVSVSCVHCTAAEITAAASKVQIP